MEVYDFLQVVHIPIELEEHLLGVKKTDTFFYMRIIIPVSFPEIIS